MLRAPIKCGSSYLALVTAWRCLCRGVALGTSLTSGHTVNTQHCPPPVPEDTTSHEQDEPGQGEGGGEMMTGQGGALISIPLLAIVNWHKEDCTRNKEISFIQGKIWIFEKCNPLFFQQVSSKEACV